MRDKENLRNSTHSNPWVLRSLTILFSLLHLSKLSLFVLNIISKVFKEIKSVSPKGNQLWIFTGRAEAEAKVPILWPPDAKSRHWKRLWCCESLRPGGGADRGLDGWMASATQWTWVWTNSGRQWRTGQPGVLQSIGLQRIRHNLATEPQQFGKCIYSSAQCQWMANSKYSIKQWAFIIYNDMK